MDSKATPTCQNWLSFATEDQQKTNRRPTERQQKTNRGPTEDQQKPTEDRKKTNRIPLEDQQRSVKASFILPRYIKLLGFWMIAKIIAVKPGTLSWFGMW